MKHTLKALLCALVALTLLLAALVGCKTVPPTDDPVDGAPPSTPETPETPDAKVEFAAMSEREKALYLLHSDPIEDESVSSLVNDMTMTFSGGFLGITLAGEALITLTAVRDEADSIFYCQEGEVTLSLSGEGESETFTLTTKEGYADGKMFTYSNDTQTGRSYALWSALTGEEFLAHKKKMTSDSGLENINTQSCASISCTETPNGWEASFSNFSAKGLRDLADFIGELTELFEEDVEDVELKLCVDKDLMPQSMELRVIYEGGASAPTMAALVTYSEFGTAEPYAIDLTGYRKVGDLRSIERLNKAFEEAEKQETLSFSYAAEIEAELPQGGTTDNSVKSDLSISQKSGGLTFRLLESLNGTHTTYVYENGNFKGGELNLPFTEEQARALLANYLRPVSLELWRVQDCYSLGANEYRIELIHPDTAPVDALIEAYGTYDSLLCAGELYVKLNSSGGLNRLIYDMAVFVYPTASGSPSYEIDYHVDCKNYSDTVY